MKDQEKLVAFIKEFPFATFILKEEEFPLATHIPMEVVMEGDKMFLYGHISNMNPQAIFIGKEEVKAMAVFSAGHTYVSSSWYSHPNVSTWNYRAVHVSGILTELTAEEFKAHLFRMQNSYEQGQAQPALAENLPGGLFEKFVKAIRGFKVEVVKMEGAWKLSQNRNEKDYQNVIAELEKSSDPGAQEVAREMKKRKENS